MAAVWLPDLQKEIFAEDEITTSSLAQIFKQAFFKTSFAQDGDLIVHADDGVRVKVIVDLDRKLLNFMSAYRIKESAPLELKHAFVNKMNDEVIMVRFSVSQEQEDVLVADYALSFEEGVLLYQIVATLKLFSRIIPGAIHRHDENGLVE